MACFIDREKEIQRYIRGDMSRDLAAAMLAEYDKNWYLAYLPEVECVKPES